VVRPWCKAADYWDVYFDITENVKYALEANGLTIPFPQRDVHMISTPAS
ncbi:MAG: mechanosensitive ion channel family protein, partial [Planctomycetota bacterium]